MFEEWINNPVSFIEYCMTINGWNDPSLSIDRIDNNGDYIPGNIRFATKTIQSRNKRSFPGKTGYTGVVLDLRYNKPRYKSGISINNRSIHIGTFDTAKEAAIARDQYITDNNLEGFNLQVL